MSQVGDAPRFWTVSQLAARLRVHRNTVRLQIERGLFPATRTPGGRYRIAGSVVEQLLRGELPAFTL